MPLCPVVPACVSEIGPGLNATSLQAAPIERGILSLPIIPPNSAGESAFGEAMFHIAHCCSVLCSARAPLYLLAAGCGFRDAASAPTARNQPDHRHLLAAAG
jgi:hypothetical protein